jgi:hypothetical protein
MAQDLATSIKLLAAQSRQSQLIGSTNQTMSGLLAALDASFESLRRIRHHVRRRDLTNSAYSKGRQT